MQVLQLSLGPNWYRPCCQLKSAGNLISQRASVKLSKLASSLKSNTLRSNSSATPILDSQIPADDAVASMPLLSTAAQQQHVTASSSEVARLPKVTLHQFLRIQRALAGQVILTKQNIAGMHAQRAVLVWD